jgi:hypothetical protein
MVYRNVLNRDGRDVQSPSASTHLHRPSKQIDLTIISALSRMELHHALLSRKKRVQVTDHPIDPAIGTMLQGRP